MTMATVASPTSPGNEVGWITADEMLAEARRNAPPGTDFLRWDVGVEVATMMMEARVRAGLSRKQLASRMGVTHSYICQLERGTANPSVLVLARVLRACGLKLKLEAIPPGAEANKRRPGPTEIMSPED